MTAAAKTCSSRFGFGNRSNASGLGIQVEGVTGELRFKRTAQVLPVEIDPGTNALHQLHGPRWFDLSLNNVDVEVKRDETVTLTELILPTGSCPYLYCWDGERFAVTDLLGASPLGLPVAEGVYIDGADPDEIVWLAGEDDFKPIDGTYRLQITEELREILYLDEAKLIAVDVPTGTEVHPNADCCHAFYPEAGLVNLGQAQAVEAGRRGDPDVTGALQDNDDAWLSPVELREPQLRGLAKPTSVELDFGKLDTAAPLALAMTGLAAPSAEAWPTSPPRTGPNCPFPSPCWKPRRPTDGKNWISPWALRSAKPRRSWSISRPHSPTTQQTPVVDGIRNSLEPDRAHSENHPA